VRNPGLLCPIQFEGRNSGRRIPSSPVPFEGALASWRGYHHCGCSGNGNIRRAGLTLPLSSSVLFNSISGHGDLAHGERRRHYYEQNVKILCGMIFPPDADMVAAGRIGALCGFAGNSPLLRGETAGFQRRKNILRPGKSQRLLEVFLFRWAQRCAPYKLPENLFASACTATGWPSPLPAGEPGCKTLPQNRSG